MTDQVGQLDGFVRRLAATLAEIIKAIEPHLPAILSALEEYVGGERAKASGWLPHDLLPMHLVTEQNSADEIDQAFEKYFIESWTLIEQQLRDRYAVVGLDDEALSTMDEALRAHRHGLYRAVCRLVFPEIDRVAKLRYYYGAERVGASLKELRKDLEDSLSLQDFGGHGLRVVHALDVFERISYAHFEVATTSRTYPNRHALAHGSASFSTMRDSVNTLLIADFMFHGIRALEVLRNQVPAKEMSHAEVAPEEGTEDPKERDDRVDRPSRANELG